MPIEAPWIRNADAKRTGVVARKTINPEAIEITCAIICGHNFPRHHGLALARKIPTA